MKSPSAHRPWKLATTNYGVVKQHQYEVAVLPIGATEPHNMHLPYSMDTLEGDLIGEKLCEQAWADGGKVILLPTIPYSTETNQREFPFSMNVNPSTLYRYIEDLVESLLGHGIQKIVILNSHGGNDLKGFLREMYGRSPAKLFLCDWFRVFRDVYDEIFDLPDDHAGEMETSIAMAFCPELIGRDESGAVTADDGNRAETKFEAVNEGWISITRPWHLLTTNAGAGDPRLASAEKGEKVVQLLVERLSGFLVELSESEVDEQFPY